jgi:hypothetical protein
MLKDNQAGNFDDGQTPLSSVNSLNKNQKITAIFLAVFALAVVVLWFVQFKNSLQDPYQSDLTKDNNIQSDNSTIGFGDATLKSKDTDNDSLSDYDELNVYRTSPYLEDSDSDGIKDGDEIKNGKDPNCPEGKSCYGVNPGDKSDDKANLENPSATAPPESSANNSLPIPSNTGSKSLSTSSKSTSTTNNINDMNKAAVTEMLSGNTNAAKLRQTLISLGMDPNMLKQISDEELMKSYKSVISEEKK